MPGRRGSGTHSRDRGLCGGYYNTGTMCRQRPQSAGKEPGLP
jgi:hypothetical protein